MKRLYLVLAISVAGTCIFYALRSSTTRFRAAASARRDAWLTQTQLLAQIRFQQMELVTHVREIERNPMPAPAGRLESTLASLVPTNGANHLAPELRERLLAELGFDWNSSGEYVVVSKDSLPRLGLDAIRGNRLTDTVCSVLAISPEDRAGVEALMQREVGEFTAWAVAHVQRSEPEGDVLAKYTMPFDPQLSQTLSNTFATGVVATLGPERGDLLLGYASSWLLDLGARGAGPSVLTIKRPSEDEERLNFELKSPDGGTMYTEVSKHQPLPETFRPIFPGGWPDLAKREGFQLPKGFQSE